MHKFCNLRLTTTLKATLNTELAKNPGSALIEVNKVSGWDLYVARPKIGKALLVYIYIRAWQTDSYHCISMHNCAESIAGNNHCDQRFLTYFVPAVTLYLAI